MASHNIVSGGVYRLVHTFSDRGVEHEAKKWEYLKLTDSNGDHGSRVRFYQQPNGWFTIESFAPYWEEYNFWKANTSSVWLDKKGVASPFEVVETEHGLSLRDGNGLTVSFPDGASQKWLAVAERDEPQKKYGFFHFKALRTH